MAVLNVQSPSINIYLSPSLNPMMHFLTLISKATKDYDIEPQVDTFTQNNPSLVASLREPCEDPTFSNQTVGEQLLEGFLQQTGDPNRFHKMYHIARVMGNHGFETQFSRMMKIAYYLSNNVSADEMIQMLVKLEGSIELPELLINAYQGKPGFDTLWNLKENMERVSSNSV